MEWLKLFIEHPDPILIILVGMGFLVYKVGTTAGAVRNLESKAAELVTKTDMQVAMMTLAARIASDLETKFMTQPACTLLHTTCREEVMARLKEIPVGEHEMLKSRQEVILQRLDALESKVNGVIKDKKG